MSETQSPPLYMCFSIDDDDPYLHRGKRDSLVTPPPGALGVTLCGKHILDYVTPMWPTPYCVECWDEARDE